MASREHVTDPRTREERVEETRIANQIMDEVGIPRLFDPSHKKGPRMSADDALALDIILGSLLR
jgi:hypothetical protein